MGSVLFQVSPLSRQGGVVSGRHVNASLKKQWVLNKYHKLKTKQVQYHSLVRVEGLVFKGGYYEG